MLTAFFFPVPRKVENDNVVFGLRRETFYHEPTYPNALRQDKKPTEHLAGAVCISWAGKQHVEVTRCCHAPPDSALGWG